MRSAIFFGPENAVSMGTCWSSSMPTNSAKGFSDRSWSASVSCAKQSCTVNDVFLPVKGPNYSHPTTPDRTSEEHPHTPCPKRNLVRFALTLSRPGTEGAALHVQ